MEAVQANSRRVWAEEGEVLLDSYLAETPYGRQLAGSWANRIDGLREDREVVFAARRARRERREAEAAAMRRLRRRCYYCGLPGVSTDWKCSNAARHDKARPWFRYRDW